MTLLRLAILGMCWLVYSALNMRYVPPAIHEAYRPKWSADYAFACLCMVGIPIAGILENAPWMEWTMLFGVLQYGVGGWIVILAMRENPFFQPDIVRPPQRITTGLYRYLGHPGYWGMAWQAVGAALILNSRWAMVPASAYMVLLMTRAIREEKVLRGL